MRIEHFPGWFLAVAQIESRSIFIAAKCRRMFSRSMHHRPEIFSFETERLDEGTCRWDDPRPNPQGNSLTMNAGGSRRLAPATFNHYGYEERFSPYQIPGARNSFPRRPNRPAASCEMFLEKPWEFDHPEDVNRSSSPPLFEPQPYTFDDPNSTYFPPPPRPDARAMTYQHRECLPPETFRRGARAPRRRAGMMPAPKRGQYFGTRLDADLLHSVKEPQMEKQPSNLQHSVESQKKKTFPALPKSTQKKEVSFPDPAERLLRPLRILTVTPTFIKMLPKLNNTFPLIFELFGMLASKCVSTPKAKKFHLKTDKDVIPCTYYEIDRPLPALTPNKWIRCMGLPNNAKLFQCVSVRLATESETKTIHTFVHKSRDVLKMAAMHGVPEQ